VVLAAATLMGLGVGTVEIGLPALAVHSGSSGAAGLLLALWSIGSMCGGFVYGTRSWRWPTATRYPALMALVAVTTAPLIAADSLAAAIPLSAVAGVAYAPMLSCEYGLVATLAPSSATAGAYTWTAAGMVAGFAGGSAVAGPLVEEVGVWSSFALASAITALAAVVALAGRRRTLAAGLDSPR
jgi:MFS family permease